MVSAASEIPF